MKAKLFFIVLIFLFILPTCFAQNIPNLPVLKKYVTDNVGVLSQKDISDINYLASKIEQNSTVQVAVLVINSTQPYAIDEYANQVFRANGIGQKENNNGILIVAAIADRKWWIDVGYGLEGLINDAKAGDIGRTYLVPNFQKGEYGLGLFSAVQSIGNIVEGQPEVIASNTLDTSTILIFLAIIGLFILPIFIVLIVLMKNEFYQKCPKDGTRLHMHIRKDGIIYECAKCGYKKKKSRRRYVWFWVGAGGWSEGGGYGGGGGGFGGGSSGGGGAGGGW
jgi:uncharacterized protein